jgi:pyridoxamine 5'-phosphate oxidase
MSVLSTPPFRKFLKWYAEAERCIEKNPNAMVLATCDVKGRPSARVVLYKGVNQQGLKFFTNYLSRKGSELLQNPHAAVVFYWPAMDRQIRVEGRVKRLTQAESDAYWQSRPLQSQWSASVSPQSAVIQGRNDLKKKLKLLESKGEPVPRPTCWGGYCMVPQRFEFWVQGDFRFHERLVYLKKGNLWHKASLAP